MWLVPTGGYRASFDFLFLSTRCASVFASLVHFNYCSHKCGGLHFNSIAASRPANDGGTRSSLCYAALVAGDTRTTERRWAAIHGLYCMRRWLLQWIIAGPSEPCGCYNGAPSEHLRCYNGSSSGRRNILSVAREHLRATEASSVLQWRIVDAAMENRRCCDGASSSHLNIRALPGRLSLVGLQRSISGTATERRRCCNGASLGR